MTPGPSPTPPVRTFVRVGDHVHELFERRPVVVGRSGECDIVLHEAKASRQHCRMELVEGTVHVLDLGSTNGLLVNGAKVEGACETHHGDVLNIGHTTISILVQRRPPRASGGYPRPSGGMAESTSQGTNVLDIFAGGAEAALDRGDLHAAETSARNLLTAIKGRSGPGRTVSPSMLERAIALCDALAEKTGDRSLLERVSSLRASLETETG